MQDLKKLQDDLRYEFKDKKLLQEALTHKSTKLSCNNERLEFLGDAVLDLIIGEYLFKKFPQYLEGDLSKLRAALVNEKSFATLARALNLGENLTLSTAEEHNLGREKDSLLSNAFEAIIGAIYLESGIDICKEIALYLLEQTYTNIGLNMLGKDYKTALQELTQARFGYVPEYKLISAKGPDHKKEFLMALLLGGEEISRANGNSKKDAEQKAACEAMAILKSEK